MQRNPSLFQLYHIAVVAVVSTDPFGKKIEPNTL